MGLLSIEHSPAAYRADFAFYGCSVLGLATFLLMATPAARQWDVLLSLIVGLLAWGLVEYILHRHVLHGLQPFARWHATHHARPMALIGSPTVVTAGLFLALVFVPACLTGNVWRACALTLGLGCGYLAYSITHHAMHHWHATHPWLRQRQLMHALHHHGQADLSTATGPQAVGHYGVTSGFWDRVFGT